jgi:hypothetical protein
MTALIPTIKWSQNDEYIIINLEINQVKNDVYEINNNNIVFSGVSNTDLNYSINLVLLYEINKDESKYIVEERVIRFILKKTEYEKWIRLTMDKNQYKSNIKINWDSFEDSDEETPSEQTQNPNQQFDFSSMMNMGGENNGFNMEEMMKNMNPNEMEQLMKSMNMGGGSGEGEGESEDDDDNNDDDNNEDDNNEDDNNDDDNNDDDNNDDDNNDDDNNDDDNEYQDKDLEDELDNIINNDEDEESIDSDDLCQECDIP